MREERTFTSGCGPYQLKMSVLLMECIFANIDRVPNDTFHLYKPSHNCRIDLKSDTKHQFIS